MRSGVVHAELIDVAEVLIIDRHSLSYELAPTLCILKHDPVERALDRSENWVGQSDQNGERDVPHRD